MATRRTSSPTQDVSEMQAAAALILQREEARRQKTQKRTKRRRRERRQEEHKAVQRMHRSIEVIKWCIVAICSVWLISFIISIVVLIKVQSRVAEIEGQVQNIRNAMENPFANVGTRLGEQVDDKWKELFGLSDSQGNEK